MPVFKKESGVWVAQSGRPYLKHPTLGHVPIKSGLVKSAGVWTEFYAYDATPPVKPTITLTETRELWQNGSVYEEGRYVKVLVHPNSAGPTDPTIRRTRLLVSNTTQPTSQYSTSYYIAGVDEGRSLLGEPWSEIWYHGYNGATRLDNVAVQRHWTRNATASTTVPPGTYYFSAWNEDFSGNWSLGTYSSIVLANFNPVGSTTFTRRYQANNAGSFSQNDYVPGEQRQADSPNSKGVYLYGNQFAEINTSGANPQIKSAQIFLHRKNDTGADVAHVYLGRHTKQFRADIGGVMNFDDAVRVGNIAKGESKWFDIPTSFWTNLENGTTKGFGLNFKDPDAAAATNRDFSVMKALSDAPRSGEVHVTWTEVPA